MVGGAEIFIYRSVAHNHVNCRGIGKPENEITWTGLTAECDERCSEERKRIKSEQL